jgi:cytoskeleton protein RodZ
MQTIGERLEEARKRKGISIREAAEATKIRGDYLQKFESNQFDINLAEIYVRGFLRGYAQFLKLPADKIINDLNGLGFGSRPKTPSREVYGRMDLSVATADEIAASAKESGEGEAGDAGAGAVRRTAPAFNRPAGSGMPPGPWINPSLVIKGGIGLAAALVIVLVVWGISAMFGGKKAADPATVNKTTPTAPATPAATERTIRIIALQTVSVQVNLYNADESVGDIVLPNTQMKAGDSRVVPWRSRLYITASAGENVQIEVNGRRVGVGFTGFDRRYLPSPTEAGL